MKVKLALILCLLSLQLLAQNEGDDTGERKGFQKEKLFTGGSLSLGFSSGGFQAGVNPMFGYSVTDWLDAGVVVNYNHSSFKHWYYRNDKMKQSTFGAGAFARLYPIRSIFAQAQYEQNFTNLTYDPGGGAASSKASVDAPSLLLGAGYTSQRYPGSGQPFFYLSILFDVLGNTNSPYVGSEGAVTPIFRAGIQVPLFQGRNRDNYLDTR